MNFELDEQQQMLRTTARGFLAAECDKSVVRRLEASESGHTPGLWKKMADLGWPGLAIPESYGGVGANLLELAVLFEEIGRAAFASPLFATVVGALALLEAGDARQKRELLPRVAAGELILTLALAEREVSNDLRFVSARARREKDSWTIRGTKLFVPYASVADQLLVVARTAGSPGDDAGLGLFLVDARGAGVRCTPLQTIAPDKQFQLELEDVPASGVVGSAHDGLAALARVLSKAAAIRCAEMLGGAEHELEATAAYTKERVQFDRPTGTFQAVQHRLADMFTDVQGARWTTYQALFRLSRGMPAARELAIASAFTTDACQRIAFSAQQLHGGVGVDLAGDLHFYYRRAKALELEVGSAPLHLAALEREIGLLE